MEEQEGWLRWGDPYSRARTHSRSKRLQVGWCGASFLLMFGEKLLRSCDAFSFFSFAYFFPPPQGLGFYRLAQGLYSICNCAHSLTLRLEQLPLELHKADKSRQLRLPESRVYHRSGVPRATTLRNRVSTKGMV